MPQIRDSAIVLKRLDYSETSQILAVFTREHGKVRIIAKGSRRSTKRAFSPGIDLLESGEVVLSVRAVRQEALAMLTEWRHARPFLGLRERLDRINAAQYIADVTAQLTGDWDPHPDLYVALEASLAALSEGVSVLGQVVAYQASLLAETGHALRMEACVSCGGSFADTRDIYISSFDGGLLCRDCEAARVEKRRVAISRTALAARRYETPADIAGAFDLYDYHISHLMGRVPAARAFLADASRR